MLQRKRWTRLKMKDADLQRLTESGKKNCVRAQTHRLKLDLC